MRKSLLSGTVLELENGQEIMVQEVIGWGGSCLVYNAEYQDSIGERHNIRIKELYPVFLAMERKENGSLEVLFGKEENFKEAKQRFRQAYERNMEIKRITGLINSTGTVNELFEVNGTMYSFLSYEEGMDYQKYQDKSLMEVLEHILAVAKAIQKYHEHGYLHLDIKPQNIFVFPETAQHIQLFDFDSVSTMDEIKSEKFRLAYSDGYSAPEQLQGRLDKLGPATDIYALGAVLFYKLFGRVPEEKDCGLEAVYDFSKILYQDERYQKKLLRGLERIFQNSIAATSSMRWQSMQKFVEQLEQLIPLANPENVWVQDNFQYHPGCFVGRSDKLIELQDKLSEKSLVFLSGIGGIGKTELAKKYADMHRSTYERIFFVPFSESIRETICGKEILIHKEAWVEDGQQSLFESRMQVLRKDVTEQDLFILDNFDVSEDDDLDLLLECKCNFIITTRNDFSDYFYDMQINVERMEHREDVWELFSAHNNKTYPEEEKQSIEDMMELVDCHTMTVELLAKYLRDTEELPSSLLRRMMEKEGITSLQEGEVKHRKDRKRREENVDRHLLFLFNLSGFSEAEAELMRSLALLGYVRMLRGSFLEHCNVEQKEEALEHLIKTGWVEWEEQSDKISLHQIILDLVYNHMNPTAENCPGMIMSLYEFFQEDVVNWVEWNNRMKLFHSLMKRLRGTSLPYARLCVLLGEKDRMQEAEIICLESKEPEAKELLSRISRWKLGKIAEYEDMFDVIFEQEEESGEYCGKKIRELLDMAETALQYAREYSMDAGYQAEVLTGIAGELDELIDRDMFFMYTAQEYNEEAVRLVFEKIMELYEEAGNLILVSDLGKEEKQKLLESIRDFYKEGEFTHTYRAEHYGDLEKALYYQQLLDSMEEEDAFDVFKVTLGDVARRAYDEKRYVEALGYYEQMLKTGEYEYSFVLSNMADIYQKKRNFSRAIECLKEILKRDQERMEKKEDYVFYDSSVCCELVDLLRKRKRISEAKQYARELVEYNRKEFEKEKDMGAVIWMLAGYYRLYLMEQNLQEKAVLWKECLNCCRQLETNKKIFEDIMVQGKNCITAAILAYADNQKSTKKKVQKAMLFLECMEHSSTRTKEQFFDYILKLCKSNVTLAEEHIRVLLLYAGSLRSRYPVKAGLAVKCSREAQRLWEEYVPENKYLESKVYDSLAESYNSKKRNNYEQIEMFRKRCDYALIAETESKGKTAEQQAELWNQAADSYGLADNTRMKIVCLERAVKLLEQPEFLDMGDFDRYWRAVNSLCMDIAFDASDETERLQKHINRAYTKLIPFFRTVMTETEGERTEEELEEHIRDMADNLERAECGEHALLFYTLSVYVAVVSQPDWKVMESAGQEEKDMELLFEAVKEALQGEVTPKQIDRVIETFGKMKPLFLKENRFEEVKKALEEFSMKHEQWEMEFKREE